MLINIHHLIGACKYSLAGIKRAWIGEQAFRHEVLLFPIILLLLAFIRPGFGWAAVLIFSWLVVMAFELVNSAIEEAFDLITKEQNIHVKYGKDMASAAIFFALCGHGVLWLCMLADIFMQ